MTPCRCSTCSEFLPRTPSPSEFKSLAECRPDEWNRILATNLTPAFLLARAGESVLRGAHGAKVLISSTRNYLSEPDTHAYSATKGA